MYNKWTIKKHIRVGSNLGNRLVPFYQDGLSEDYIACYWQWEIEAESPDSEPRVLSTYPASSLLLLLSPWHPLRHFSFLPFIKKNDHWNWAIKESVINHKM